jgi:hypothetical protein
LVHYKRNQQNVNYINKPEMNKKGNHQCVLKD